MRRRPSGEERCETEHAKRRALSAAETLSSFLTCCMCASYQKEHRSVSDVDGSEMPEPLDAGAHADSGPGNTTVAANRTDRHLLEHHSPSRSFRRSPTGEPVATVGRPSRSH